MHPWNTLLGRLYFVNAIWYLKKSEIFCLQQNVPTFNISCRFIDGENPIDILLYALLYILIIVTKSYSNYRIQQMKHKDLNNKNYMKRNIE